MNCSYVAVMLIEKSMKLKVVIINFYGNGLFVLLDDIITEHSYYKTFWMRYLQNEPEVSDGLTDT